MDETTFTIGLIVAAFLVTLWAVCRRGSNGSAGSGSGRNPDPVRDDLERAGEDNKRLEELEQRTEESIGRAEEAERRSEELIGRAEDDNRTGQELVQKAKDILHSAKHID